MKYKFVTATFFVLILSNLALAESYQVDIRNLTVGQTITEPLCVAHTKRFSLFKPGTKASKGLYLMAEDGVVKNLKAEIKNKKGVKRTKVGEFISAGDNDRLIISAKKARLISCAAMLATTNDGFIAIRNVKLPSKVRESVSVNADVYDAGSEFNSESCTTVPGGPCSAHFVRDLNSAEGTIQMHEGIKGTADINAEQFGWEGPAAGIGITRVK